MYVAKRLLELYKICNKYFLKIYLGFLKISHHWLIPLHYQNSNSIDIKKLHHDHHHYCHFRLHDRLFIFTIILSSFRWSALHAARLLIATGADFYPEAAALFHQVGESCGSFFSIYFPWPLFSLVGVIRGALRSPTHPSQYSFLAFSIYRSI